MKIPAWIATAATVIGAALLPACDAVNLQEIKPGITTASEVKTRMGEPGFQHWNNDGTATWEYSRQPSGTQCYMITFEQRRCPPPARRPRLQGGFRQLARRNLGMARRRDDADRRNLLHGAFRHRTRRCQKNLKTDCDARLVFSIGQLPFTTREMASVATGVVLQIVLMLRFSHPERPDRGEFSHHLARPQT